jgi:hypothetical protein
MLNSVQSLALMKQQWHATVGMQGAWYQANFISRCMCSVAQLQT